MLLLYCNSRLLTNFHLMKFTETSSHFQKYFWIFIMELFTLSIIILFDNFNQQEIKYQIYIYIILLHIQLTYIYIYINTYLSTYIPNHINIKHEDTLYMCVNLHLRPLFQKRLISTKWPKPFLARWVSTQ